MLRLGQIRSGRYCHNYVATAINPSLKPKSISCIRGKGIGPEILPQFSITSVFKQGRRMFQSSSPWLLPQAVAAERFITARESHDRRLLSAISNGKDNGVIRKGQETENGTESVRIGNVEKVLRNNHDMKGKNLIPNGYLSDQPSQTILRHLQWMLAKDNLKQDMLLIGPPGAGSLYRRRLAMMYAELTRQEVEILTISADMTENDLKQRRELVYNNAVGGGGAMVEFMDQAPVRAAIQGRTLILDGLEKAERNVLPTLNNLLENREMHLEDGRFLVSPERFKELSRDHFDGSTSFLVPTHEDFRVVALGVPAPPYDGRSLDPPLRSRFQIRRIDNPTTDELYEDIMLSGASAESAKFCALFSAAMESDISGDDSTLSRTLDFPFNALPSVAKIIDHFPDESKKSVLVRAYPMDTDDTRMNQVMSKRHENSQKTFTRACDELNLDGTSGTYEIDSISPSKGDPFHADISISVSSALTSSLFADNSSSSEDLKISVPSGGNECRQISDSFVQTVSSKAVLMSMIQDHFAGRDILLISPKGEGKSAIAMEFASILGYKVNLFGLYKEMSGRDLIMRRTTDSEGETGWADSQLIEAAKHGHICILDGIEKLSSDTLGILHSLLTDRELALPDGSKLSAREDINDQSRTKIHPSFRVVALGSISKDASPSWLTEEAISMFSTVALPAPSHDCLSEILKSSNCSERDLHKILHFHNSLTQSTAADCGVSPLSTRNLLRIVKRTETYNNIYDNICSLLVAELIPPIQRAALESLLAKSNILPVTTDSDKEGHDELKIDVQNDVLKMGENFVMERKKVKRPEMVPSPLFYDIPSQLKIMKRLLNEWTVGERAFLLLGNQGVGKNKVIDRICEIANFEREYIQLHRDSTIGQLTLSPSLEDGKIVWNDSPLVRAVIEGCSLVIDEADKAPVEVISVLKSLIEDGELLLGDGRRISRNNVGEGTIPLHPDFTIWVIANRPGFPFHGNDLFEEVGDCFSSCVIPNPNLYSEINLLKSYAPSVDEEVLRKIAASFAELRHLFEKGDIGYPYSAREAVSVAKHFEKYPNDDIVSILHNVIDMDSYDKRLFDRIGEVFREHGFPVKNYGSWKAKVMAGDGRGVLKIDYLTDRTNEGTSNSPPGLKGPKHGKWDENNEAHVGGNQWAGGTGGSDTAGLGGRGGPYRLDRGHQVHQVSDEAKKEVSKEAAAAARKIAEKALKERLDEIGMSEREWETYEGFIQDIKVDIANLRGTLQSVQSKTSERDWIKRQSHGEVDESKLVDAVTGDRYIYKRRGTIEPQVGQTKKPKRLRFVMDCSGSMYRFNGHDQRLNRSLEAAALVMESFDGMEQRFDYSIVGHSGDSRCIELVNFGKPPKNAKERMVILQTMVAHSQFCQSGDNTIGAIGHAIQDEIKTSSEEGNTDDSVVIAVSDANLARYGISPHELGKVVSQGSSVSEGAKIKAFCIFIASFGSEAEEIKRALPLGRSFLCLKTSDLPRIVRNILTVEVA